MSTSLLRNGFATLLLFSVVCLSSSRPVDGGETFQLEGNVVPVVAKSLAQAQSRVRGEQKMPRMSLHFAMTADQRADLDQLLTALQNRRSTQYHKFLTPEEYATRFGVKPADLARVQNWLEQSGFTDLQVARGGRWISFSGTAAQAEAAFHVTIQHYSLHGETHFANAENPQLPKALQGIVAHVGGLHNFAMKSQVKPIHPQYTSSFSGANYLVPDDWATIYDLQPLYGAGLDGSGITIAIVGQSDVLLSDLRAFRAAAGLAAKDPTIVIPTGSADPGFRSDDETESDLDLEWSGGIARNANILFVTASATTGNGVADSIAYVVDNNAAPILSISYGECEADEPAGYIASEDAIFQQASAEGITVLVASGDTGAATCDEGITESAAVHGLAVSYPASSQYVTAVGGSRLDSYTGTYWGATNNTYGGSALSYIPEEAWNDGFQESGGGGASIVFSKPVWQTGNGVPNDNARDLPDVAFAASANNNGYLICGKGWCTNGFRDSSNYLDVVGGTSASAPSFAALLALVMQKGGGNRLGNINANLYSLAQISTNAFHDITSGSNIQICQAGTPDCANGGNLGYYAGTGYDLVTGLGSVDGYNFAQQWFADFTLSASTQSLTIQPGSSGSATVSVVPQNNFSGPVTFTCSVAGTLVDVTCSVPTAAVSGAGGSTTVTITAATTAHMPWWRQLPGLPPMGLFWMLAGVAILLAACISSQAKTPAPQLIIKRLRIPLVAIALGAVSCGGGGGGGSSSSGSSDPPVGPLALTCNLPNATVGVAYSGSCSASGGTAPYHYSITLGVLPAGLTLNAATGTITGTATAALNDYLNFHVTDSGNPAQGAALESQNLMVVTAALTLSCQLPAAMTGVAYSGSCSASGGNDYYHYSITSGALPQGLTLNTANGSITGTPVIPTTTSFVVQAVDTEDTVKLATYNANNFVVSAGPLVISCTLPGGVTGGGYTGTCSNSGGTPPVTYSISGGSLPSGITLAANGLITGYPVNNGTSSFTLKAVDAGAPAQVVQLNQSIAIATGPLSLYCALLAKVNSPVTGSLCSALGGNQPFKYSVISGSLPAGIMLNSSTGIFSGIPTTAENDTFTVQATDSSTPIQTATKLVNVYVQPTTTMTLTCPAQQPLGALGNYYPGGCGFSGGNSPYTASVISGTVPPGLTAIAFDSGNNTGLVQFNGVPTQMGTYTVGVQLTDGSVPAQTATAQTTITIGPRASETGLVTITATSGAITNTTTITVTVP